MLPFSLLGRLVTGKPVDQLPNVLDSDAGLEPDADRGFQDEVTDRSSLIPHRTRILKLTPDPMAERRPPSPAANRRRCRTASQIGQSSPESRNIGALLWVY